MDTDRTMEILLIEDSPADAEVVIRLLNDSCGGAAFNIRCERRLEDALKIEGETPDVVLLDLNLPDSVPGKTFSRVADRFSGTAVVVMTSFGTNDIREDAFTLGAQDFVDKNDLGKVSLWKTIGCATARKKMEIAMTVDRENLDKANSILQTTSEISKDILDGKASVEDMLPAIGLSLGIDGVAVFCDKCLGDNRPHCFWTGGKMKEEIHLSEDCTGYSQLDREVTDFITCNIPVFSRIMDLPGSIGKIVDSIGFKATSKVVVVPILMEGEPWGIFCFYTCNGKCWSMAEVDALSTLSRLGSVVIRNKQMENELVVEVQEKFSVLNRRIGGA